MTGSYLDCRCRPGGQPLEKGVKARLLIGSTVENISFNFANIGFRGIFQVFLINFRIFYLPNELNLVLVGSHNARYWYCVVFHFITKY